MRWRIGRSSAGTPSARRLPWLSSPAMVRVFFGEERELWKKDGLGDEADGICKCSCD